MLNSLPENDYLQVSLAEGVIDHLPVLIIIRKQNIINPFEFEFVLPINKSKIVMLEIVISVAFVFHCKA